MNDLSFHQTVAAQRDDTKAWQLAGVMGFRTHPVATVLIEYEDGRREWRTRGSLVAAPTTSEGGGLQC